MTDVIVFHHTAGHRVSVPDLSDGATFDTLGDGIAGAKGALLFGACVSTSAFGAPWPQGVPLQIHAMDADALLLADGDLDVARGDLDVARALAATIESAAPFPAYDEGAATLLEQRVLGFLDDIE